MDRLIRFKIGISVVFALIILIPTAATLRAANSAKPMMSHDFVDVPIMGQEFMEPYINAFYHQGITTGCSVSPLMYCPSNSVTRGSMAVFMGRALGYVDMDIDGYNARAYFSQTATGVTDHGVAGRSINGAGVLGLSEGGIGVYGISDTDFGVRGTSGSSYGVYANSTTGVGMIGTSITDFGIVAESSTGSALMANAYTQNPMDKIYDIELGGDNGEMYGSTLNFYSGGDVSIALDNDDDSGVTPNQFIIYNGVDDAIFSVDETGVTGTGPLFAYSDDASYSAISGSSTYTTGVYGTSTNELGVYGFSMNDFGMFAASGTNSGLLVQAGEDSSTDVIYDLVLRGVLAEIKGELLHLISNDDFTIDLDNDNNTWDDTFSIRNGANAVVFSVTEAGVMTATGTKSAIVDTVSYGTRAMYAVEATEVLFEDVGSAELVDGEVVIEIDPIFAETVNLEEEYHVFLTPVGGWADLYIAEMTETSFTVRSADGSDVQFSYRIVAKRLGYEDVRMEEVTP